jgi:hypothetical protein
LFDESEGITAKKTHDIERNERTSEMTGSKTEHYQQRRKERS